MAVKEINSQEEFNEVIKNKYVFIDFYANWCGPCKMLEPIIHEIASEVRDVIFVSVDVDKNEALARTFNVYSIPAIYFLVDGKAIKNFSGYLPKEEVLKFIEEGKK